MSDLFGYQPYRDEPETQTESSAVSQVFGPAFESRLNDARSEARSQAPQEPVDPADLAFHNEVVDFMSNSFVDQSTVETEYEQESDEASSESIEAMDTTVPTAVCFPEPLAPSAPLPEEEEDEEEEEVEEPARYPTRHAPAPVANNHNHNHGTAAALPMSRNLNGFHSTNVKTLDYPPVYNRVGGKGKMGVVTCGGKHSSKHTGRDCMRQCMADREVEYEGELRPAPLGEGESRDVCHMMDCHDGNPHRYPSVYKFKVKNSGRLGGKATAAQLKTAIYLCSACPDAPAVWGRITSMNAKTFWLRHIRSHHGVPNH